MWSVVYDCSVFKQAKHWNKTLSKAELRMAHLQGTCTHTSPFHSPPPLPPFRSSLPLPSPPPPSLTPPLFPLCLGERLETIRSKAELVDLVNSQRAGLEATQAALDRLSKATGGSASANTGPVSSRQGESARAKG